VQKQSSSSANGTSSAKTSQRRRRSLRCWTPCRACSSQHPATIFSCTATILLQVTHESQYSYAGTTGDETTRDMYAHMRCVDRLSQFRDLAGEECLTSRTLHLQQGMQIESRQAVMVCYSCRTDTTTSLLFYHVVMSRGCNAMAAVAVLDCCIVSYCSEAHHTPDCLTQHDVWLMLLQLWGTRCRYICNAV
jgi:hypothetical protein